MLPNDYYRMEFFKHLSAVKASDIITHTVENADAESLRKIFTEVTGMDTVVPVIRRAGNC